MIHVRVSSDTSFFDFDTLGIFFREKGKRVCQGI